MTSSPSIASAAGIGSAKRPMLATAWTATALIERLLITDWLTRLLRVSGQIVVVMEKRPTAIGSREAKGTWRWVTRGRSLH